MATNLYFFILCRQKEGQNWQKRRNLKRVSPIGQQMEDDLFT